MIDYNHEKTLNDALAALQVGDASAATRLCRLATERRPSDAEGWSILGLALAGDEGVVALEKAVSMEPREPRWYLHLGRGLANRGQNVRAEQAFSNAAELSRGHPEAMKGWANSLMVLERYADAAQIYRRILGQQQSPELWIKAGDALMGAMDTVNAVKAYQRAYPEDTRPASMNAKLADLNILLNHYDEAERFNTAVLTKTPDDADAGLRQANILRWRGDHAAALTMQQASWNKNKSHTGLIAALLDDKDVAVLDAALSVVENDQADLTGRRRICFALARHYDRAGDLGQAWHYADLANSCYNDGIDYRAEEHEGQLHKAIAAYQKFKGAPAQDTNMVYVMGPPRCGGSLLQTILCRAEGVNSVGERGALLGWLIPGLEDFQALESRLPDLAKADIAGMARAEGEAKVYVDKTSPHIIVAGLLAKIHEGAQFVIPVRNKADMIVSMYFHDFPPQFVYTRSVKGIADYLAFQDNAALAWREAGLNIIEHDHDAFVQSPETQGEALFKALGWQWSSSMLNTDQSDTIVRTFSARQVRGGVSKKYAGRGARYAEYLKQAGFTAV
ncbi:MAG: sulfotransferase [Alphaproteobacteria bacterium]